MAPVIRVDDEVQRELEERAYEMRLVFGTPNQVLRSILGLDGHENLPPSAETELLTEAGKLQPIVRNLMKTLLEDQPTLLDHTDICNLMDPEYCKRELGLQLTNHALLRSIESGRQVSGHDRYYKKPYAGKFYVCSEWWRKYHVDNARSLLKLVTGLIRKNPNHPGIPALKTNKKALRDYIG